MIEIKSGAKQDGALTAWEFHNYHSGGSGIRSLYEVPGQVSVFHSVPAPLRDGSYRALASTANHFARESHMDELARGVKLDPLEFRLKNLKDARLRAVLEAAATKFGWGKKSEGDHGIGIAAGFEKGSYVATCAEVAVDRSSGRVAVVRATIAFECGAVVNPDHLKNQVEGAVIMGLGGAYSNPLNMRMAGSRMAVSRGTASPGFATRLKSTSSCSIARTCRRPEPAKHRSLPSPQQSVMPFSTPPVCACDRCRWCRTD